jgi:hypothetical protein
MSSKIYLISFLLFIGCSTSNVNEINLEPGQALVSIENQKYDAKALIGHQMLEETEYEKISLIINDSVEIKILKKEFIDETIYWSIDDHVSQEIFFALEYNYFGGTPYLPLEGYLVIAKEKSIISGEFDITLHGGIFSCVTCPQALKKSKGEFIINNK